MKRERLVDRRGKILMVRVQDGTGSCGCTSSQSAKCKCEKGKCGCSPKVLTDYK